MPTKVTANRLEEFVTALDEMGGSAGNKRLRLQLEWGEDFYWRVQGILIEQGRIVAGQGRGGSVRKTGIPPSGEQEDTEQPTSRARERDLYGPLKSSIETKWINRFGLDEVIVAETHSRGSFDTGGTFTRPDITVAGIKRYVFLPKRLEIVTFEIKLGSFLSIMGVLEAIAHREAAHRSYVFYSATKRDFEVSPEADRILELAQKYGIGVVVAEDSSDVDTWEILLDALRHEPDPSRLDRFLGDLPDQEMKKRLSKWKE